MCGERESESGRQEHEIGDLGRASIASFAFRGGRVFYLPNFECVCVCARGWVGGWCRMAGG